MSKQKQTPQKQKQTTLFQTWGYEGNPSQSTSQVGEGLPNKSINDGEADLFSDDDEMLAMAMEQSLVEYQGSLGAPSVPSATPLEQLPGFDVSAGATWIYPTNYPVREYQFDIVKSCLFQNTLVCLPTGLGKTLIAAVVMYNFYRWYPQGKIVFMAPTKPLVGQQIEACFNIMGIPQEDTMEMTGSVNVAKRAEGWKEKRVFFLTPQVMSNDLSRGLFPARDVKLLVVDEAHKAQGEYAYCLVARELARTGSNFRVMALSATPGNDIEAVKYMLTSLYISYIELRSEDSPDVTPYTHERKLEKIVIPMSEEILEIKRKFLEIMEIYTKRLSTAGAIRGSHEPTNFTKYAILEKRNEFRQNPPDVLSNKGMVEADFATLISLYHAYDLLLIHGMRPFFKFMTKDTEEDRNAKRIRAELGRVPQWRDILAHLTERFSGDANFSMNQSKPLLTQTATAVNGEEMVISHPKIEKLKDVVVEHFNKFKEDGKDTRVMIFSQFRESVDEIVACLATFKPLVKPMKFVGQAGTVAKKGLTQKEQIEVVRRFREGGYNTLVATCVGEEGLDIGEVDLIVCFDVTNSPIQMVQRMGRTGRKREGRIVVLVAQGKEESTYNRNMFKKKTINKAILEKDRLAHSLYDNSPRMVPRGLEPKCHKMKMIVNEFKGRHQGGGGSKGKGQIGITGMLKKVNKYDVFRTNCGFLSEEETERWGQLYKFGGSVKTLEKPREVWLRKEEGGGIGGGSRNDGTTFNLSEYHLWQKGDQHRRFVGPGRLSSTYTRILAVVGDPAKLAAAVSASQAAPRLAEPVTDNYMPSNREEDILDREKSQTQSKNNIFNYFKPKQIQGDKKVLTKVVDLTTLSDDDDFVEEDIYIEEPVQNQSRLVSTPTYKERKIETPFRNNEVIKDDVAKSPSFDEVHSPETKLIQDLFEDCDSGLGLEAPSQSPPLPDFQKLIDFPPTQEEVDNFDVKAAIREAKERIFGKHIKKLDLGILGFDEPKQIGQIEDIIAMPNIQNDSMADLFDGSENDSFFDNVAEGDDKKFEEAKNGKRDPFGCDSEFDKQTEIAMKMSLAEVENNKKVTPIKNANQTANFDLGSPFVSPQNSQRNEPISSPVFIKKRILTGEEEDTISALPIPSISTLATRLKLQSSTPLPGKRTAPGSLSKHQPQDLTPITHRERNPTSVMRNAPTLPRIHPSLGRDLPVNESTSPRLASKLRKAAPPPPSGICSTPPAGTSRAKLTDDMFGSSDDEIFNMVDNEGGVPLPQDDETMFSATQLVSMVNKTSSGNSESHSHVKNKKGEKGKPKKKLSDVFAHEESKSYIIEKSYMEKVGEKLENDIQKAIQESLKDGIVHEAEGGKKAVECPNQDDDVNAMFDLSLSDDMFASQEIRDDPKNDASGEASSNLLAGLNIKNGNPITNESSNLLVRHESEKDDENTNISTQSEVSSQNLLDQEESLDLLQDDGADIKPQDDGADNKSQVDGADNKPQVDGADNKLPEIAANPGPSLATTAKSSCPVCNAFVDGDINVHLDLCLNGVLLEQLSQENSFDEVRAGTAAAPTREEDALMSPVMTGRVRGKSRALESSDEDSPAGKYKEKGREKRDDRSTAKEEDDSPIVRSRGGKRSNMVLASQASPMGRGRRSSSDDDSPIARGRGGRRGMVLSSQMPGNDTRGMSTVHSISSSSNDTITKAVMISDDSIVEPERLKKKKRKCEFLEHEASVSGEDSGDDDEEDDDKYDESFVDDASQANGDQEMYLRSVKSPTFKHPAARPRKMRPITDSIFSQVPDEDDDAYEDDSFCVGSQEVEYETEMDTLDLLDYQAENGKSCKRKRDEDHNSGKGKKKRKRILNMSSDDETVLGSTLLNSSARETTVPGSPLLKSPINPKTSSDKEEREKQERLMKQKQRKEEFQRNQENKNNKPETENAYFDLDDFDDDFESQDLLDGNNDSSVANNSKMFLKPDLTDSINAAEKVTVIVATGEVNKVPEIISTLKHTHKCNVKVMISLGASFILSQRMCAQRIMESDFSSGTYRPKLLERLVTMREQYEKVLLIIESEKVKPGERARHVARTKYLDRTIGELCHTRVQVLHTTSQATTAAAMADCAAREASKKFGLPFASVELTVSQVEMVSWYQKLPGVGLGAAIHLAVVFPTIRDLAAAKLETLMTRGNLGRERAGEIVRFISREFQPDPTEFEPL